MLMSIALLIKLGVLQKQNFFEIKKGYPSKIYFPPPIYKTMWGMRA